MFFITQVEEENHNDTQNFKESDYRQSSEIRFTATQPGTIKCKARNKMGDDKIEAKVQIVDLLSPLIINGIDDEQKIAVGDELNLDCGAIIYNYTNQIQWFKDGSPVDNRSDLHIHQSHTRFSYRKVLKFDKIQESDNGEYRCEVIDRNNESHDALVSLKLHEAEPPLIVTNFNQSSLSKAIGETLTLGCFISGLPVPKLTW